MIKPISILLLIIVSLMSSCAQEKQDYVITITTKYGDMVAILYDETPRHKENFIKLAKEHYFDGTLFHRVVKDFMIQGGDPDSKTVKPGEHLGNGGPGYTIPAEINPKFFHEKGALCAARLSDPANPTRASSGSQFYIVQGRVLPMVEVEDLKYDQVKLRQALQQFLQIPKNRAVMDTLQRLQADSEEFVQLKIISMIPRIEKETGIIVTAQVSPEKKEAYTTLGGVPYLDGQYTVFGKVVKGLDVIDKIARLSVDDAGRPQDDMSMVVKVSEMSRKKIAKVYGYTFPETK
jgi:peptidyl-prolyl cis-trans isomerase B (cyclophilin B)